MNQAHTVRARAGGVRTPSIPRCKPGALLDRALASQEVPAPLPRPHLPALLLRPLPRTLLLFWVLIACTAGRAVQLRGAPVRRGGRA